MLKNGAAAEICILRQPRFKLYQINIALFARRSQKAAASFMIRCIKIILA